MLKALAVAGLAIAIVGGMDDLNRMIFYRQVDARIISEHVECYIQHLPSKAGTPADKDDIQFLDCDQAALTARNYGLEKSAIKQRVKYAFEYVSPADGEIYKGENTVRGANIYANFEKGALISIYASLGEPDKYRIN